MSTRALANTPHFVCSSCRLQLALSKQSGRLLSTSARRPAKSSDIDDYYALLLNHPLPTSAVTTRPKNAPPSSTSTPATVTPIATNISPLKTPTADLASRARLVFGSREAGPEAREKRRKERDARARVLAGVRIPPRPKEPDNCCMSGCVNCVWDLYREELEEWAERRQEAEMKMHGGEAVDEGRQKVTGGGMAEGAISMDDDGGGSETNWDPSEAKLPRSKDLFESVPVGIREFMKVEKRLGQKRQEREAAGRSS